MKVQAGSILFGNEKNARGDSVGRGGSMRHLMHRFDGNFEVC